MVTEVPAGVEIRALTKTDRSVEAPSSNVFFHTMFPTPIECHIVISVRREWTQILRVCLTNHLEDKCHFDNRNKVVIFSRFSLPFLGVLVKKAKCHPCLCWVIETTVKVCENWKSPSHFQAFPCRCVSKRLVLITRKCFVLLYVAHNKNFVPAIVLNNRSRKMQALFSAPQLYTMYFLPSSFQKKILPRLVAAHDVRSKIETMVSEPDIVSAEFL